MYSTDDFVCSIFNILNEATGPSFIKPYNFWACWIMAWNTAAVLMLEPPLAVVVSVLDSVVWEWVCDLVMPSKKMGKKERYRRHSNGHLYKKNLKGLFCFTYMYIKILKFPIIIVQKNVSKLHLWVANVTSECINERMNNNM